MRRLAGGRLAFAGLHHIAHIDFGDARRIHAGALHRRLDRDCAELGRGRAAKAPWNFPIAVLAALKMTTSSACFATGHSPLAMPARRLAVYFSRKPCASRTSRNPVRVGWDTRRAECSSQP